MKKKLVILFCLFEFLSLQVVAAQDRILDESKLAPIPISRKHEICSICSSYLANQSSLVRGDALIEINELFDTIGDSKRNKFNGLKYEETIRLRLIFDMPAKRLLLARFHSISQRLYDHKMGASDSVGSNEEISAVVLTEDECHGRTSPGSGFEYPNREEQKLSRILSTYRVPDLRQIGFTPFGSLDRVKFSEFEGRMEMLTSGSNLSEFKLRSGKTDLVFKIDNPKEPDFTHYIDAVFSSESLMPERVKLQGVKTKADGTTQSGFVYSEKIDWENREGVYVPTKIKTVKPTRHEIGDSTFFDRTNATINFRWLSVNGTLEKSRFDSDVIYDLEKLTRLVVVEEELNEDKLDEDEEELKKQ